MYKIRQIGKKILFYYKTLSILKKFLLAPLVGIVLVLPFYMFIFLNISDMKKSVESANTVLIPIYEMSGENILLLENIVNEINGATIAKEVSWIEESAKNADKIRENLNTYKGEEFQIILKAFNEYYEKVKEISIKIIKNDHNYKGIEQETKSLIQKHKKVDYLFKNLKENTKKEIEKNFNSLYENTDYIITKANQIFFIWVIASGAIILLVYLDLRFRIKEIVESSKEIAKGDVDFEKRLCSVSYDELGQIVRSINVFINKLHKNHEELSMAKKELDELYIMDRLTSVYNRIKMDEIIETALKKQKRYKESFSVILLDIDHFKNVNDTHGHLMGDLILKEFASILKENIRETDFVGRWGGEEFIIVCPKTDKEGAVRLAQNLRVKIENSLFATQNKKTASFGVAECQASDNITSIIDNADKALYKAKKSGRNRVVCYDEL